MKAALTFITITLLPFGELHGFSQGFINLDFEAADVSGYSLRSYIPVTLALPGWNAYSSSPAGTNAVSQIVYDGLSLGGSFISIVDANAGFGSFGPLNGNFSAYLFGGGIGNPYSAQISQIGLIPFGTETLLFDAYNAAAPFVVTLGGQVINVIPLQTFSNYTLYGGDISPFAGQLDTLSFIEPPASFGGPSFFGIVSRICG